MWKRDGGSCVFEGPDGNRCGSTWNVEIDHIEPFALGGEATEDNLRLLCAPHNDYWRRHFFGPNVFSGDPEAAEQ
ncbi:MAG: HNH endonuclease [Myxococcaceae bacterium]